MRKINLIALTLFVFAAKAQTWQEMVLESNRNFYDIQKSFNAYWETHDQTEKGNGYKAFKRWEYMVEPRVYPSGDLGVLNQNWTNFEAFAKKNPTYKLMSSSTWTAVGPMGNLAGLVGGLPRKAGRDNFITFHPVNTATFWCGAPAGGLWKTTDGGQTWSTNTDLLNVIGCSDMAIDPVNNNIMYLATGDGDGTDTKSIGVLKSTDGGQTWLASGLTFSVNQSIVMRRLLINPTNPQIIIAATSNGIYRSTDAGANWTKTSTLNTYDMEFKPTNPNVVYASGSALYRSTNGGASFSIVSSGISTAAQRMSVAVTPADTNYVYVIASSNSTSGLLGFYRSTNGGSSFSTMATSPDILANPCNNPSGTGQGWYDLALGASPLNKDEVAVGGVNVWRSTNGGANWSCIGCWNSNNPAYVHADHHELEYTPSGVLYTCNDGGVSKYTGTAWTDLTNPRNIAQIYKIGLSSLSPNLWITGHQDNGSNIYNNGVYSASMAGDGMDCFIDRTNNNTMFASFYNGAFMRSTNGGNTWGSVVNGLTGTGPWVSPWKQDPVTATVLYAGYTQMFKSTNLGNNWTQIGNISGSGSIVEFAVAPSNPQVIYTIRGTNIYKTINGGTNWTLATGNVPVSSAAPTFITIDPNNANVAWVTLSGYSNSNKVFVTTNGGTSWTNITYNLPNLPANCSVYQPGTTGRIYIGMDVGVYYKDHNSTVWTLYNSGLPNTIVRDMEISPAAPTKLRAATYGRGVYEVDLVTASGVPPVTDFSVTTGAKCANATVTLVDNSQNLPTTWSWTISPAANTTVNSTTAQYPVVIFPSGGTYTVSLEASSAFGSGGVVTKTITISPALNLIAASQNSVICEGDNVTLEANGGTSYTWTPGNIKSNTVSFVAVSADTYTVKAVDANGCSATTTVAFELADCTSIKEAGTIDPTARFNVFPNPVASSLLIRTNGASKAVADICDVHGRVILSYNLNFTDKKPQSTVDVQSLATGIYFVRITEGSVIQVFKVIKE